MVLRCLIFQTRFSVCAYVSAPPHAPRYFLFLVIKILVLCYETKNKHNNSNNRTHYYSLTHRYETWNLSGCWICTCASYGDRKVTAGIQWEQGLVNKFCGNISKWHLHQDKLWTFTYSPGLVIWEVFDTVFLEGSNFVSSQKLENMPKSLRKAI